MREEREVLKTSSGLPCNCFLRDKVDQKASLSIWAGRTFTRASSRLGTTRKIEAYCTVITWFVHRKLPLLNSFPSIRLKGQEGGFYFSRGAYNRVYLFCLQLDGPINGRLTRRRGTLSDMRTVYGIYSTPKTFISEPK